MAQPWQAVDGSVPSQHSAISYVSSMATLDFADGRSLAYPWCGGTPG